MRKRQGGAVVKSACGAGGCRERTLRKLTDSSQAQVSVPLEVEGTKPQTKPADWPEPPKPPPGATELERLTYPPGLLGHVVQYIYETDRLPDRLMALAGALLACSKALDRRVIGPGGISVLLWLLIIAESGAGKHHVINCLRTLLRAMGVGDVIVGTGIASVQSIDEILEGQGKEGKGSRPSALVIIDEYGSFLTRIASKGQTGNVSEIPGKLQTLWGWSPEAEYIGDTKVGKGGDRLKVHGPAFSMFGAATEHSFFTALKKKNVSGGFVNRHFLLNAGRGRLRAVEPKYSWLNCEEWLLKALQEIVGRPAPIDNRPCRKGKLVVWDFRKIGWGPGVWQMHNDFEFEIRSMPSVHDREIWIRTPEIALRIATILAVFRGSNVVEASDFEWGMALAKQSTKFIHKGMTEHMLEEYEQADLVEHIREEFRRRVLSPMPNADRVC
jgi:hypothetical protein